MEYRQLGKSGIRLSEISFGSWITFGSNLDLEDVRKCLRIAIDHGINFFDTAEVYGGGLAELLIGEALREFKREQLVISTKLFWGGAGPNEIGLSSKRILEGIKHSLRRLQTGYVDLLFCHRPDPQTPIEETVRAMDIVVRSGLAFYWGTSEWSRQEIEKAHEIARELGAIPPSMEQPEYNLFHRDRVEKEYAPLYETVGMGLTTWSPLDSGILTGKYNNGIPVGSRLSRHQFLQGLLTRQKIEKVKQLGALADELRCTLPQLAIAWCLKNRHVTTVLTGATSPKHIEENVKASQVKELLTEDVLQQISEIIE